MKTPIERIEHLEKLLPFLPMLEEMSLEYESHKKAQELTAPAPDLKPVAVPSTGSVQSQPTDTLAALQPGVLEPTHA